MEKAPEPEVSQIFHEPDIGESQAVLDLTDRETSEAILRNQVMESGMMKFYNDFWHQDVNIALWSEMYNAMEDRVNTPMDTRLLQALNQLIIGFKKWYQKTYRTKNFQGVFKKVFEEWIQKHGFSTTYMNVLMNWNETFENALFEVWTIVKKHMRSSLSQNTTNTSTSSTTARTNQVIADATDYGKLQIGRLEVDRSKTPKKKVSFGTAKKAHSSKTTIIEENDDSGEEMPTIQTKRKKRERTPSESENSSNDEEEEMIMQISKKKKSENNAAYEGMLDALVNRVSSTNCTAKICSSIYTRTGDDYITLKSEELSGDIQIKFSVSKICSMQKYGKRDEWKAAHYRSTVRCSSKDSIVQEAIAQLQTVLLMQMEKAESISVSHVKPGSWSSG